MNSKVFVGGLHWNTTEPDLKELFSEFGPVRSVRIILDRETGRSRGFGFVEFSEKEQAELAVENLNGKSLDNRSIKVSMAIERERKRSSEKPASDETGTAANGSESSGEAGSQA